MDIKRTVTTIGGEPVQEHTDGRVSFRGGMTIDADGSPRAYGPKGTQPLDYLGNAGYPGNWWGIATTKSGIPYIQRKIDPYPGYYVSTTSLLHREFEVRDPNRYINSEVVPFIVVPIPVIRMVKGVVMGCKASVTDAMGREIFGVVADGGPATHLGEASIAMADALGIPSDAKKGGTSIRKLTYSFWPGVAVDGFKLQPARG